MRRRAVGLWAPGRVAEPLLSLRGRRIVQFSARLGLSLMALAAALSSLLAVVGQEPHARSAAFPLLAPVGEGNPHPRLCDHLHDRNHHTTRFSPRS